MINAITGQLSMLEEKHFHDYVTKHGKRLLNEKFYVLL